MFILTSVYSYLFLSNIIGIVGYIIPCKYIGYVGINLIMCLIMWRMYLLYSIKVGLVGYIIYMVGWWDF